MPNKKLIMAVGGTGGHIYPALGLADRLLQQDSTLSIQFIGGGLSKNRFFSDQNFPYKDIPCDTISFRKPARLPLNLFRIMRGVKQSYQFIRNFKPSLVMGFGSFYSLPTLVAAKLANIPFVLHEQNSIPGRVNRLLSRYAAFTGVYFPDAMKHLKGKCLEVDMPLRESFRKNELSQQQAKEFFGLDPHKPLVLVFGGSQGARKINQVFCEGIGTNALGDIQLLHLTGDKAYTDRLTAHYQACGVRACVKDYENEMNIAWAAADFVVSRAGAGSIAEQIEFEVPGILIPYPFAMDNHQDANGDFMADYVGGAVKVPEQSLVPQQLIQRIVEVFEKDRLLSMKQKIIEFKSRRQVVDLCSVIEEML